MKRSCLMGVALLLVFSISAVDVVTAAAALPEFLGNKSAFTSKGGKAGLETLGGTGVECAGSTGEGTVEAPKVLSKVKITFKGCRSSGFACEAEKAGTGVITTHELTGTLGYEAKGSKVVIVLLKPTKAGDFFTEFNCAGGIVKNKVLGVIICPITPTNNGKLIKEFKMVCTLEAGDQKPTKDESDEALKEVEVPKMSINGGAEEDSAELVTAEIATTEALEIMA